MKYFNILICLSCVFFNSLAQKVYGQSIFTTDFNREEAWYKDYRKEEKWVGLSAKTTSSSLSAKSSWGKFGTIDVAYTTIASDGLQLLVDNTTGQKNWTAGLLSGLLPVKNIETNLGKLTLSFDHSVSSVRPVVVSIESFDAAKKRTGGLETTVYAATANHFLRSAIELATMKVAGEGKFNPQDPYIQVSFQIADNDSLGKQELRIDNFCYTTPAYYVSPLGKDSNDGRTEKTAFANPQAALNVAKPGDIILMMNGEYLGAEKQPAVASFTRSGTPASWITLKSYPGHKPVILCHAKDGVLIAQGNARTYTNSPVLAYIEIRVLILRGNSEEVLKQKHPDLSSSTPITETTGVTFSPILPYFFSAILRIKYHLSLSHFCRNIPVICNIAIN